VPATIVTHPVHPSLKGFSTRHSSQILGSSPVFLYRACVNGAVEVAGGRYPDKRRGRFMVLARYKRFFASALGYIALI
jgi:hypothetical protein